jgi:multicomponent Na+:H+ antiporter subunit D
VLVAVLPRRALPAVTVAAAAAGLIAALALPADAVVELRYYGYELTVLRADGLALPFVWAFAGLILLGAVFGWGSLDRLERVAALATAAAGIGVVLAGDLLTLFFFWEAKVTTAVLLIAARRSARSAPASLRYLGVHLVGGVLLLAARSGTWWTPDRSMPPASGSRAPAP